MQVDGRVQQRPVKDMPTASTWLRSPDDSEARYCPKRTTSWVGYRTPFIETCDPDHPRLITPVTTTAAPEQANEVLQSIQADLVRRALKTDVHLVDAGYVEATNLVHSQQDWAIALLGPARLDTRWQAKDPAAFDSLQFSVNWESQPAVCPAGQHSIRWLPSHSQPQTRVIRVQFATEVCSACALRARCTHGLQRVSWLLYELAETWSLFTRWY